MPERAKIREVDSDLFGEYIFQVLRLPDHEERPGVVAEPCLRFRTQHECHCVARAVHLIAVNVRYPGKNMEACCCCLVNGRVVPHTPPRCSAMHQAMKLRHRKMSCPAECGLVPWSYAWQTLGHCDNVLLIVSCLHQHLYGQLCVPMKSSRCRQKRVRSSNMGTSESSGLRWRTAVS